MIEASSVVDPAGPVEASPRVELVSAAQDVAFAIQNLANAVAFVEGGASMVAHDLNRAERWLSSALASVQAARTKLQEQEAAHV